MSGSLCSSTTARGIARVHRTAHQTLRSHPRLTSRAYALRAASRAASQHQPWRTPSAAVLAAAATVALLYGATQTVHADAPPNDQQPEMVIEKSKKKKGASKEQIRDLISSQHLQVKKSWENPGVYLWGSNSSKTADPSSNESYVKTPRRLAYFDDMLLRDLKLDRDFGAAVLENGDLVQWGKAYTEDTTDPKVTLKGKNLAAIEISRDRIVALSKTGTVYSVPVSKADQETGPKPSESSWIPFLSGASAISYRTLTPPALARGESIASIAGGLEHVLLLSSRGRVFSAASSSSAFPSRGQLGVPGITWASRPPGPYDTPHEITTLKGFDIVAVAAGDTHSMALDRQGRVFAFGDNSSGQLGLEYNFEAPYVDAPVLMPFNRLYQGTNQAPRVTSIAAGGQNTFFTVDATRVLGQEEDPADVPTLGRVTADTWACGNGIKGSLGTGKWTHISDAPTKVAPLSGLFEYDEVHAATVPIRLARVSVGATHAAAVMSNVTYLDASARTSENDTNWGADVLFWGGNEFFQLGTGRRNNLASPSYIRPLDMGAEIEMGRRDEHRFHLTPRKKTMVGGGKDGKGGRLVEVEQRVVCGRNVTGVYSGV